MKRIFAFLFLLALTTAGKATPAPEALQRKSLKFAVISDLHQDIMHDAPKRLTDFLQAAKDQEVDFIINLGDFCQVKKENAAIMKMWNGYDGEKHLALGNHDMDNCSKEEYIRFAGMPGRYYSFDKGDFHFIVLDPNHVYDGKKYIPYSHGKFYVDASKREFIDEEQMEWLKNDLRNTQKRCILFSHQCLENVVGNRTAVRAILEDENRRAGFRKVVAAFSGHSHTPCDLEYCMTQSRTALYKAQVAKLKERYAGKLDILCGLEWDLFSDDDPTQYDYWIGSTHYVRGPKTGKYYEIDWREEDLRACIDDDFDGDALAVVEAYFANVAKVAEKKPTILGHFDLIKKINGDGKFFDENDPRYTAAANAALMTAARNRCVLEVNTSAVYRGFRKDFFPSDAILKEWLVLSGNVVITADAHDTKALTYGFEAVAAKLKELGYTKVQVLGKDGFTPCAL